MNSFTDIPQYDENELAKALSKLPQRVRSSFVCACVERLMPTYKQYCLITGSSNYNLMREALNAAWAANGSTSVAELDHMRKRIRDAKPRTVDSQMFPGVAIAENTVAGVCYALKVCLTGDVQASVWVARQLYEAADAVVQQGAAEQTYITDINREIPVRTMVEGIATALSDAISLSVADLRAKAHEDGEKFLAIVSGPGLITP